MGYDRLKNRHVLIVEDDRSTLERLILNLQDIGCLTTGVSDVTSAERSIAETSQPFDLAVVDFYIPEKAEDPTDRVMRGEELAYTIRKKSPRTKIIGLSANLERKPFTPLNDLFSGFVYKDDIPLGSPPIILFETMDGILISPDQQLPKMFIVHGQDNESLYELKNFLQTTLCLGSPTVLREKAGWGKTIIEKFEQETRDVDLVFVLLTPDDNTISPVEERVRRARQNVIFETGFFYAKLQRTSGRIFLLKKGELELPTDISGIIHIEISNGIRSAGEDIRTGLKELGWLE